MNKPLVTFAFLTVAGALFLCDLCGPGTGASVARGGLISIAYAAPVQAGAHSDAATPAQPAAGRRTVTLTVKGMTCAGCVLGTRKVLTRLPGVAKADVSYEKGTAVVTYDPRKVTVEQMVAAIKTLGYTATLVVPAAG